MTLPSKLNKPLEPMAMKALMRKTRSLRQRLLLLLLPPQATWTWSMLKL